MRAVVVEDSRIAREGLVRMLAAFPEIEVVGAADHPSSALPLIRATEPDVIFLDIQMPGATGFDLLEQLAVAPRVIFTTAHAEYAVRSFDVDAVDYLLKPISQERLAQAVRKLAGTAALAAPGAPLERDSKIFIKDGERFHLVSLDAIRYFESCKNSVQVYFDGTHAYVKKSLNSVEARLPRKLFFRISRQHIVNLHAIVSIEESMSAGLRLRLDDGKVLEISRRNAGELRELLSL